MASNWLRANYEPYPGALVQTAKAHQEYCLWLQRRAGNAVQVQPGTFVACVRKVFPYSELIMMGAESHISGIKFGTERDFVYDIYYVIMYYMMIM